MFPPMSDDRRLWCREDETDFLQKCSTVMTPDEFMIRIGGKYHVFAPKDSTASVSTPQSRNAHIGAYTEKWCREFFSPIAGKYGLYAINGVVCNELGLSASTSADLAFCRKPCIVQHSEDIRLIFEIKMGIVDNYVFDETSGCFTYAGNMESHKGRPSLSRSDSMLKAIGKAINIRTSCENGRRIPIIVVGNTPVPESYRRKVDNLRTSGIVNRFMCVHADENSFPPARATDKKGFVPYRDYAGVESYISSVLETEQYFFSAMTDMSTLGNIIEEAGRERTPEAKGRKFLEIIDE